MRFRAHMVFLLSAIAASFPPASHGQSPPVEPGLERAVKWIWTVEPSASAEWGLPLQDVPVLHAPATSAPATTPSRDPNIYVVKKGDALARIARKFKLTIAQLKEFNGITSDLIHIGDEIRIPTQEEKLTLLSTPKTVASPASAADAPLSEVLLLRIFLDNQGFTAGPITDMPDSFFGRILHLYQNDRGETLDHETLMQRARESVPAPLTSYTLRRDDFRFIAPPKAARAAATPSAKSPPPAKHAPTPAPAYEELISEGFLAYRSPWEFVAERFHCDEAFLRKINPSLGTTPPAGTTFKVPNVDPFEIGKIPATSPQPAGDPAQLVSAIVSNLTVLEIRRAGQLIAAMPLGRAHPSLRGRGEWRILEAIPRPRLATRQELRVKKVEQTLSFYKNPNPTPTPVRTTLSSPQYLPSGPNNPAGVIWIQIAKSGETAPLPYGLHGTGSPARIFTHESLGGFRLANWDILRAAALLPIGTKLEWKP